MQDIIDSIVSSFPSLNDRWDSYLNLNYAQKSRERIIDKDLEEIAIHLTRLSIQKEETEFKNFFLKIESHLINVHFEIEYYLTEIFMKKISDASGWTNLQIYNRYQKYLGPNMKDLWLELIEV